MTSKITRAPTYTGLEQSRGIMSTWNGSFTSPKINPKPSKMPRLRVQKKIKIELNLG
jgi:hypothetical protein